MIKYRINRGADRVLTLYSKAPKTYREFDGLPPVSSSDAHMRWHPLRREWIGHASARQGRTFLPNQSECPLCVMTDQDQPSDIPVDDYEVAIFTNRFSALALGAQNPPPLEIDTIAGIGACDVISYSADHHASLASLPVERIALLIKAIGDRITELYQNDDIIWTLPFENRGREIGVTLDHPHGQIYSLSILPPMIKRQADAMAEDAPLSGLADTLDPQLMLDHSSHAMAFVPRWARYPFESWVMPKRAVDGPHQLDDNEIIDLALMIKATATRLDGVYDAPMPYTLAWQIAPKGYEGKFHFHLCFQPLKRARNKQKYLASVEQISGLFLVDLPPERAAAILRGDEAGDE
ncbi:MAG: galactose-1-phosphate uridylyltransferase [Candidatus Puniceispirillaceae bacterium]